MPAVVGREGGDQPPALPVGSGTAAGQEEGDRADRRLRRRRCAAAASGARRPGEGASCASRRGGRPGRDPRPRRRGGARPSWTSLERIGVLAHERPDPRLRRARRRRGRPRLARDAGLRPAARRPLGGAPVEAVLFGDAAARPGRGARRPRGRLAHVVADAALAEAYAPAAWGRRWRARRARRGGGSGPRHGPRRRGAGPRGGPARAADGGQRPGGTPGASWSAHPPALGRQPPRGRRARCARPLPDDGAPRRRRWTSGAGAGRDRRVRSRRAVSAADLAGPGHRPRGRRRGLGLARRREGRRRRRARRGLGGGVLASSRSSPDCSAPPSACRARSRATAGGRTPSRSARPAQRIAPDLYIACGISGAIQHIVGCKAAKRILAINTDAESPIMGVADYAVIGDLHAVVPAISAEIRRRRG